MKYPLKDALSYEQPTKYIVKSEEYDDDFTTPVLTAGKSLILGYTNENEGICYASKSPVIIFDDFTADSKYVDFDFKVKSSAMKILHKVTETDNLKYFFYAMKRIDYKPFSHKRVWISEYSNFSIIKRNCDEQNAVVNELDTVQRAIDLKKDELLAFNELIKSRFIEMFGDPIINERGWKQKSIDSICVNIYGGGTPSKSCPQYFDGEIPWVTPKDMKSKLIFNSIDHITKEAVDNSSTKLIPPYSVLMVIRSGILKHTLPIAINTVEVTLNQDMKAFVPSCEITSSFLANYFIAIEEDILYGVRCVTADNIDFKAFKKRMMIVPPLSLQNEFEKFVNLIDKSKFVYHINLNIFYAKS